MKNSVVIVGCILCLVIGCSTQYGLRSSAPFKIGKTSCSLLEKGVNEDQDFDLTLELLPPANKEITFNNIFFRNKVLSVDLVKVDGINVLEAEYRQDQELSKSDLIMHADPLKEVGNQPPGKINSKKAKYPFKLKESEAVISYSYITSDSKSSDLYYYKVSGIKEELKN